jgi:hypothetical protein
MKKTSRRHFGKQLTGALVSLPVVGSAIQLSAQQQTPDRKKVASQTAQTEKKREHDTPPPVLIAEGSLTVETMSRFGGPMGAGQGRKKHHIDIGGKEIAHIKIVDGSGEMLYRNDKPRNAEIRVLVRVNSADSEVKMGRSGSNLYIDLTDDKDIGTATPGGKHRTERYRLKKSADDLELLAITVAENASANSPILFKVTREDLNSHLEEARIMVWLE